MKKLLLVSAVALLGLPLQVNAQSMNSQDMNSQDSTLQERSVNNAGSTQNDYICEFQYKMGEETYMGSSRGTTQAQAREAASNYLEGQAGEDSDSAEMSYIRCNDPYRD